MKNSEIRKLAKEKMKGKMGKAFLILVAYVVIVSLMTALSGTLLFIGALLVLIMSVPLAFGYIKQMICLENGEDVEYLDFFKYAVKNFGKVWCSNLWVWLKMLPFIILAVIALGVGNTGNAGNEMISFVLMVFSLIVLMIIGYKYSMINYTIAYDKSDLLARDLVKKTATDAKGNLWRFICMNIYYGLINSLIYVLASVLMGIMIAAMPILALLILIVYYIVLVVSSVYFGIRNIAACNEFYKINILGMQDGVYDCVDYVSSENTNQNNEYNFNSTIDMNKNNYGYDSGSAIDINKNGQSDDYFNSQQ